MVGRHRQTHLRTRCSFWPRVTTLSMAARASLPCGNPGRVLFRTIPQWLEGNLKLRAQYDGILCIAVAAWLHNILHIGHDGQPRG